MDTAQPLLPAAPLLWGGPPETPVHCMPNRPRIILADDHPVVLMGAEMALCSPFSEDFAIVAQVHSAEMQTWADINDHLPRHAATSDD